jgi:hypothetical protein
VPAARMRAERYTGAIPSAESPPAWSRLQVWEQSTGPSALELRLECQRRRISHGSCASRSSPPPRFRKNEDFGFARSAVSSSLASPASSLLLSQVVRRQWPELGCSPLAPTRSQGQGQPSQLQ